jgi:hypothetical protein
MKVIYFHDEYGSSENVAEYIYAKCDTCKDASNSLPTYNSDNERQEIKKKLQRDGWIFRKHFPLRTGLIDRAFCSEKCHDLYDHYSGIPTKESSIAENLNDEKAIAEILK